MAIADLKRIIASPQRNVSGDSVRQWEDQETQLGIVLPVDFRQLMFTYGSGLFFDIHILSPLAERSYYDHINERSDAIREYGIQGEYDVFPSKNGLFPWAYDGNGNDYFWLMNGDPNLWPVITSEPRGSNGAEWIDHQCTTTEYLTSLAQGDIEMLVPDAPVFIPWDA